MSVKNVADLVGVRVLYVEDNADIRALVSAFLGTDGAGATVVAVPSADEAVAAFDRVRPDVLVSDGEMPERDGWELIAQIRTWPGERGGRIPAIAVTGASSETDRLRSRESGFDAHISKPIHMDELVRAIAKLVGREVRWDGAPD